MAEDTADIQHHIRAKRSELGDNLQELENKVKSATDWHTYFERYPMALLGLSFGGGVLLSMMTSRRSSGAKHFAADPSSWQAERTAQPRAARDRSGASGDARERISDTVDVLKGALIGVASAKVRDMLSDVIPGFKEHYENTERQRNATLGAARLEGANQQRM